MSTATVPTGNTYDKYGTTNPIERRMLRGFFDALDRMLDRAGTPGRILEIGAGEGVVTARVVERFPSSTVLGADLPDGQLADEWRQRDLSGVFADATALPFTDASFDLVLAIEVLEHVPRPAAALDELARVCASTLVASVPLEPLWRVGNVVRGRYVRDFGNTPGHVNHWSRRGFVRLVESRFDVDDVVTPVPWTMLCGRSRPPKR